MHDTFEAYYASSGRATIEFNNLLLEPLSMTGRKLLIAQYGSSGVERTGRQAIADAFCHNFTDPNSITSALTDSAKAHRLISEKTGRFWLAQVAGGLFGVVRDQIRQKMGMKPRAGYW
jgi:hypothetical protein